MYSKLTLVSIDKHKYSESKYSETSAQAALSSKEPLLLTLMPTDQLRNSNWPQGHFSCTNRNYFNLFQRQPGLYSSVALYRENQGDGMLGKFGYDDQLFSVLSAGHTPEGWTAHTPCTPHLPIWHFDCPGPSPAHTTLSFGAAQAAAGSLHLPPWFVHIYCPRTNAFYKKDAAENHKIVNTRFMMFAIIFNINSVLFLQSSWNNKKRKKKKQKE